MCARKTLNIVSAFAGICTFAAVSHAASLTSAATTAGFSLSTFATGFPNSSNVGPLGIGFVNNGNVIVSDFLGNVRVFPTDTDGQNAAAIPVAQNYGVANAIGIAQVGQSFYMSQQSGGNLVQINSNGTFNQTIQTGMPGATGLATNPSNGHIFVSTLSSNVIWDVDPIAKTKASFIIASADGLSTDGTTLYGEVGSHILGWNIATKAQVFDSGLIPGEADGTAIGSGTLAGNIFANTNGGTLVEINLTTLAQTILITGGSRGDFVSVDPNGTLLITQTDSILRLTAPAGGGFGTPVPLPSSFGTGLATMLGIGGFMLLRKRLART